MQCHYVSNYKYNQNNEIMRDVKFRGQSKQTGAWLYGSLIRRGERCFILPFTGKMRAADTEVIPATVGQYTGLKDRKGIAIYEGDVIRSPLSEDKTRPHRIFYHTGNAAFMGALVDRKELCYLRLDQDWIYKFGKEVIGNIHDNPELLKNE